MVYDNEIIYCLLKMFLYCFYFASFLSSKIKTKTSFISNSTMTARALALNWKEAFRW